MLAGQLALVVAAIFAGAALYISLVEQPARLHLDNHALLAEWQPAYVRGFTMQASLALLGFVLGVVAWWQSRNPAWALGACVLVSNWPYTLIVMMPTNRRLMGMDAQDAGQESRALIQKWGRLHAIRTGLGITATLLFSWAAMVTPAS